MAPYSPHSALDLISAYRALVQSSTLQYIWNRVSFGTQTSFLPRYPTTDIDSNLKNVCCRAINLKEKCDICVPNGTLFPTTFDQGP